MNALNSFNKTNREYSLVPTDDLIRFWTSNVKVTAGRRGGKASASMLGHQSLSSSFTGQLPFLSTVSKRKHQAVTQTNGFESSFFHHDGRSFDPFMLTVHFTLSDACTNDQLSEGCCFLGRIICTQCIDAACCYRILT